MLRPGRRVLLLLLAAGPLVGVSPVGPRSVLGCSSCPPAQPAERYSGGHVYARAFYETNALDEPMLPFRAGEAYEIEHRLGVVPLTVLPYLSFVQRPDLESEKSGVKHVALGSGNEALIVDQTEEMVVVRNDTCADFYLRVVVEGIPLGGAAGGE